MHSQVRPKVKQHCHDLSVGDGGSCSVLVNAIPITCPMPQGTGRKTHRSDPHRMVPSRSRERKWGEQGQRAASIARPIWVAEWRQGDSTNCNHIGQCVALCKSRSATQPQYATAPTQPAIKQIRKKFPCAHNHSPAASQEVRLSHLSCSAMSGFSQGRILFGRKPACRGSDLCRVQRGISSCHLIRKRGTPFLGAALCKTVRSFARRV
jgi:hypothetical protein